MKSPFLSVVLFIRARIIRAVFPSKNYFLAFRSLMPLSRKFGFDRGTPIDRFWIGSFLRNYQEDIQGHVLEIGDNRYTTEFGGNRVIKSDILDIDKKNKQATIIGDVASIRTVKSNTFDSIILTHVLGMIPEYEHAIEECYRILKPGGIVLATMSCISPVQTHSQAYWRFTPQGATHAFAKVFGAKHVTVSSFGNVLTGQCFWVGMSQEELDPQELAYNDPEYPCIVGVRAQKKI